MFVLGKDDFLLLYIWYEFSLKIQVADGDPVDLYRRKMYFLHCKTAIWGSFIIDDNLWDPLF